eukprot:444270_1
MDLEAAERLLRNNPLLQQLQQTLQDDDIKAQYEQYLQNPDVIEASRQIGESFTRMFDVAIQQQQPQQSTLKPPTNKQVSNNIQYDQSDEIKTKNKCINAIKKKINTLNTIYNSITYILSFCDSFFYWLSIFYWSDYSFSIFIFLLTYYIIASALWAFTVIASALWAGPHYRSKKLIIPFIILSICRPLLPITASYSDGHITHFFAISKLFDFIGFQRSNLPSNSNNDEINDICDNSDSFFTHFYYLIKKKETEYIYFIAEFITETLPHSIITTLLISYYGTFDTIICISLTLNILYIFIQCIHITQNVYPTLWIFLYVSVIVEYMRLLCISLAIVFLYNNSTLFLYEFKCELLPAWILFSLGFSISALRGVPQWFDFQYYSKVNYSNLITIIVGGCKNFIVFIIRVLIFIICGFPFGLFFGNLCTTIYAFIAINGVYFADYFNDNAHLSIQILRFITQSKLYHSRLYKLFFGNMIRDKMGHPDVIKRLCVANYFLSGNAGCNKNKLREYFETNEKNNYSQIKFSNLLEKNKIYMKYTSHKCDDSRMFIVFLFLIYGIFKVITTFFPFYWLNLYWTYVETIDECVEDLNEVSDVCIYDNNLNILQLQWIFTVIYGVLLGIWYIMIPFIIWFIYISIQILPIFVKHIRYFDKSLNKKFSDVCNYFYNRLPSKTTKIYNELNNKLGAEIALIVLDYIQPKFNNEWRDLWLHNPKYAHHLY